MMRRDTPIREPDLRALRRAVLWGTLGDLGRDIASAAGVFLIASCLVVGVYLVLAP